MNLTDVSCATPAFCGATDDSGNAYTYDGTSWSAATLLGSSKFFQWEHHHGNPVMPRQRGLHSGQQQWRLPDAFQRYLVSSYSGRRQQRISIHLVLGVHLVCGRRPVEQRPLLRKHFLTEASTINRKGAIDPTEATLRSESPSKWIFPVQTILHGRPSRSWRRGLIKRVTG